MLKFNVERLGNESIIVLTISGTFGDVHDLSSYRAALAQLGQMAATIEGTVYRITDAHTAQIQFGDLVMALGESRGGEKGTVSDPRMKSIFVGSDELIRMAAQSFTQEQYGHINVQLCSSLDEAIARAREQLAAEG